MNKFIKGLQRQVSVILMIIVVIGCVACGSNGKDDFTAKGVNTTKRGEKVEDMIKKFFDSQEWKYRMYTDEDSVITFKLAFDSNNEKLKVRIDVYPDDYMYNIIGGADTKIPVNCIDRAIWAINEYNRKSNIVCGCIEDDGTVIFWLGRNTDGNSFSKEAFKADFDMVLKHVDNETAQIFKQATIKQKNVEI